MTEETNIESVLRRVAKLLAIAEDGRANAEEASAAAGMAERIMRKFQIEHADVLAVELKRGDAATFGEEDVGSSMNPEGRSEQASGWAGILAVQVANFHDCQVRYVQTYKHGRTLRFQGYSADTQMARFTYVYLVTTMAAASRHFLKTNEGTTRRDAEGFRRGFCAAIGKALKDATAAKKAEMQQASSSRELVLVKGKAIGEHFGVVKYCKTRGRSGGQAFSDGFERGSSVDVTRRGVSSGVARAQLT